MSQWCYYNPVAVHFGAGVLNRVAERIGQRNWLLVTHADMPFAPMRERIIASTHAPLAIVDAITPNPSLNMLQGLCGLLHPKADEIEVIVALGGGSVIDTAKFLAAGRCDYRSVACYLDGQASLGGQSLPVIAIPTTAGTGSELTKWATIWDPEQERKLSLNRDDLYAEAAFIDPDLTASLPWPLTVASGLDALSHALESIWNRNANPTTRLFAIAAARDVLGALPRLRANINDPDARSLLSRGAMNAGLAFSNTQTALAHNISYPITLRHGIAHGIACSFSLPEVMAAAIGMDAACDAALCAIFGDVTNAPQALRAVLTDLGIAGDPAAYDIGKEEWRLIVADAFEGPRGRNFIGLPRNFPDRPIA